MPVAVDYELTIREAEKALRAAQTADDSPQHLDASTYGALGIARSAACCSAAPPPSSSPSTDVRRKD